MRFSLGPLPKNEDFIPLETGWRKLREPGPILLNLLAVPAAVVLILLTYFACRILFGDNMFTIADLDMPLVYWGIALLIPVHEFAHALCTPHLGMTRKTVIGFWYQRLQPYAIYTDAISRTRLLWFLVAPFLILTVLPVAVMWIFRLNSPFIWHLVFINAGASAADFLQLPMFISQVHRRGLIRNKGSDSYWKPQSHNQHTPRDQ